MGKFKKSKHFTTKGGKVPLHQAIEETNFAQPTGRVKVRQRRDQDEEFVDKSLSKKIIQQARKQQEELIDELDSKQDDQITQLVEELEDDEPEVQQSASEYSKEFEKDFADQMLEVSEEDQKAFDMFLKNPAPRRLLCDIIMEKINEKQTEIESACTDLDSLNLPPIKEELKEVFKEIAEVLSNYRSGKLPKAFKMIPRLPNWQQILLLTEPDRWTAASMYQATRIFASNLQEKMAQRFYNLVLLPRIRDEICEQKRLNFHLYQALRKALFKPAAFMKGILLPLCESGTCTLREAIIIGSVIQRNSVPILHSCATMLKIAEMEYSGANSIFLRIFLDKKYALPFRVVDALVFHFLRFQFEKRTLPVLWHQALLTFAQRYKQEISTEQQEALLTLIRHQSQPKLTPEIRRELQHAIPRDSIETPLDNPTSSLIVVE